MSTNTAHARVIISIRIILLVITVLLGILFCRIMPKTTIQPARQPTPTVGSEPATIPSEPGLSSNPPSISETTSPSLKWTIEVIDSNSPVGIFSTLVMADGVTPYTAYLDDKNDDLKIAIKNGVYWSVKAVLSSARSEGWHPSLAVDKNGMMHLSTLAYDDQEIIFGSLNENGAWDLETAAVGVKVRDISLLYLPDNSGAMVYFDEITSEVQYIQRTDKGWSAPSTIDKAVKDGITFPAVVGQDGRVHTAFTNDTGGLSYAVLENNRWRKEKIGGYTQSCIYPSLAVDIQGNPHLSYYNQGQQALGYAAKIDGDWRFEIIDNQGNTGKYTSTAVDQSGNLFISYYDEGNSSLKLAFGTASGGENPTWIRTTVDDQGNVGTWNSLALDSTGYPHISYYDEGKGNLKFAHLAHSNNLQTNRAISVFYRSGQTFVTWVENNDLQGEVYRVYRSDNPIDEGNFQSAQRLAQVGENSTRVWASYHVSGDDWRPRITERMVIEDNSGPLQKGIGALVWTLGSDDFGGSSSGTGFYAVTITPNGEQETLHPGYSSLAVKEEIGIPDPVEISQSTDTRPGSGGHYYLQYMDLRNWNPTFHAPNSTNLYYGYGPDDAQIKETLAYTYDYSIFEPTAELCGGTIPETLPVMVFLHGHRGNRYGSPDVYPYPYCAYGVYPIDQSETWYFGFAQKHDFRRNDPIAPNDVIENYTEQRILRMVYDLMRKPPGPDVDPQRIYLFGHSMGGTGALAFAQRYPNVFAATYSGQPVTKFTETEGVTERWPDLTAMRWGSQTLNLPIAINAPNNWAAHLQKYAGVGVFDWQNLPAAFDKAATQSRAPDEMAPFGVDHGTIDDAVIFSAHGQPLYPILNASTHTWAGGIVEKNHEWSNFGWPLANLAAINGVPFYNFGVIRDETIPGLGYHSENEVGLPDRPMEYNQTILWSASWNPWDGAPVDTPDTWQMSFCSITAGAQQCGGGNTFTVDITPRRLQQFIVQAGMQFDWANISIVNGRIIEQGVVTANDDGLITVETLSIFSTGNRLIIRAR